MMKKLFFVDVKKFVTNKVFSDKQKKLHEFLTYADFLLPLIGVKKFSYSSG